MRVYVASYRLPSGCRVIVNRSVDSERPFCMKLLDVGRYRMFVLCIGPLALEFVRRKGGCCGSRANGPRSPCEG